MSIYVRAVARGPAKREVGWSTKPARRKKPSAAEKELAERAELSRARWARRHPEIAKAERQLRKSRAETLKRWDHKHEGTPETHEHNDRAQRREGSLARLCETGAINAEQLAAAEEIGLVAERIAAGVKVKTASLETRVDVTRLGDGTFYERLSQVRHERAYMRWRGLLPAPAPVLAMLTGERLGLTIAAKQYGIGAKRLRRLLVHALDLWPKELRDAVRAVDQEDLDRARAQIRSF